MKADDIHTHDLISLATLSSIFRNAVEQGYSEDWFVHQTISHSTSPEVLNQVFEFQYKQHNAYDKEDYSRDAYLEIIEHNERVLKLFTSVVGAETIKSYMPQAIGGTHVSKQFQALNCPELASFFTKPIPAKPSRGSKIFPK
jgi:hypothetical protein